MRTRHSVYRRSTRPMALGLALSLLAPSLTGCTTGTRAEPPPPVDDTRSQRSSQPSAPRRSGMSTGKKVALLAGAAALYYLYNKHKNAQGEGAQGQYYLSKNGRVYYRDREGRAHWVTPPREAIQVPAEEAQQYSRYQGYNGSNVGEVFGGYGASAETGMPGGPPGPGGR